ncbi:MAG: hypothetical protein ABFD92_02375 [Planctomycetaceae bacterium]|nr:hypothetical protein [Planctomycetaceae bacterium]
MSLQTFLEELLDSGDIVLAAPDQPSAEDIAQCRSVFLQMDRLARLDLPAQPPQLDAEALAWSAVILYCGCQALTFRDIPAQAVTQTLSQPCPKPASPSAAYSVDLALRHLPQLIALARGLAGDDPLVYALMDLAQQWPLSSVGVAGVGAVDIGPFVNDPSLRQLYADRILRCSDLPRAQDPRVGAIVRAGLGIYDELCPAVAAAIKEGNPT